MSDNALTIAGKSYNSRLIIGTGKYKSYAENAAALEASGAEIVTVAVRRVNLLCNLPDEELSPAALAARVVLLDCVRALVAEGRWSGTRLMAEPPATPAA